jgi:hypothetical protein
MIYQTLCIYSRELYIVTFTLRLFPCVIHLVWRVLLIITTIC